MIFDKNVLETLYLFKHYTRRQLAKLYNCSQSTIDRCLFRYGITFRYDMGPTTLYSLYITKGYSAEAIADKYDCSASTIRRLLRKYNIHRQRGSLPYIGRMIGHTPAKMLDVRKMRRKEIPKQGMNINTPYDDFVNQAAYKQWYALQTGFALQLHNSIIKQRICDKLSVGIYLPDKRVGIDVVAPQLFSANCGAMFFLDKKRQCWQNGVDYKCIWEWEVQHYGQAIAMQFNQTQLQEIPFGTYSLRNISWDIYTSFVREYRTREPLVQPKSSDFVLGAFNGEDLLAVIPVIGTNSCCTVYEICQQPQYVLQDLMVTLREYLHTVARKVDVVTDLRWDSEDESLYSLAGFEQSYVHLPAVYYWSMFVDDEVEPYELRRDRSDKRTNLFWDCGKIIHRSVKLV